MSYSAYQPSGQLGSKLEHVIITFQKNEIPLFGRAVEVVGWQSIFIVILCTLKQAISNEDFYIQAGEVRTKIVNYLDDISMKLPYPICFNAEMDVMNLYKLFDLRLEEEIDSLLQKVIDYLKIMSSLCGVKLIVFVNIKNFLCEEQILELYKASFYCKINLLLIESAQRNKLTGENIAVLDGQDCLIHF